MTTTTTTKMMMNIRSLFCDNLELLKEPSTYLELLRRGAQIYYITTFGAVEDVIKLFLEEIYISPKLRN